MFRRCVAAFVLLGFLAGQLAMVPHAHAAGSPDAQRQHSTRPHFHVGGHAHDHSHAPPAGERSPLDWISAPGHDHDADAIYLSDGNSTLGTARDERVAITTIVLSADLLTGSWQPLAQQDLAVPFHPPDPFPAGRKLFLTLRTLRI
ncbi:MAG TPA: hypothetical protein VMP01_25455 [Pirellulaceae bacterium]|nr:hypothetical protein [Pirellulaceae bacterium]